MRKSTTKAKEIVKLRFKELANGNKRIYLDYYHNGKREYEFLKAYTIIPENTTEDKAKNKKILQLAEAIKAKRIVSIQTEEQGFKQPAKSKVNLCKYVQFLADKALKETGNKRSTYHNLLSLNRHLIEYKGNNCTLAEIDEKYLNGFISYLKTAKNLSTTKRYTTITKNTQNKLFNKFSYVLNEAERNSIINHNPIKKIDKKEKPKAEESKREYLTIDEVKTLIKTDCTNEQLKQAFIFCCLTGLRFSDAKKITWKDFFINSEGETELQFRMQKTKRQMYLQISNEALKWLPERNNTLDTDLVYTMPRNDHANEILNKWVTDAKINKHITFHSSRHTAATLLLSKKVPIEVVSKLLGHTKISTTQIYAKIVNQAQREAVNIQNGLFN